MIEKLGSAALAGMRSALENIVAKSERISQPIETQDSLVEDIVSIKASEFQFKASAKLVGVERDLENEILNILA